MIIRRIDIIAEYQQRHADSFSPLQNWVKLARLAKWQKPQDIKNAIRSADFLSGNRMILISEEINIGWLSWFSMRREKYMFAGLELTQNIAK